MISTSSQVQVERTTLSQYRLQYNDLQGNMARKPSLLLVMDNYANAASCTVQELIERPFGVRCFIVNKDDTFLKAQSRLCGDGKTSSRSSTCQTCSNLLSSIWICGNTSFGNILLNVDHTELCLHG